MSASLGSIQITDEQMAAVGIGVETPPAPAPEPPTPAAEPEPAPAAPPPADPEPEPEPAPQAPPIEPTPADPALLREIASLRADLEKLNPPTPAAPDKIAGLRTRMAEAAQSDDANEKATGEGVLALIDRLESLEASVEKTVDARVQAQLDAHAAQDADADRIDAAYNEAFTIFGIGKADQAKVDTWAEQNLPLAAVLQPHEVIARALGKTFLTPVQAGPRIPDNPTPPAAPVDPKDAAVIVMEPGRGGAPGQPYKAPDYGKASIDQIVQAEAAKFGL